MMPFIIIFALINEAIGSSEVTTSPGDNLNKDDRDEFGYKPGDVFYSKPGTGPNPFLADMWEKSDETWYK